MWNAALHSVKVDHSDIAQFGWTIIGYYLAEVSYRMQELGFERPILLSGKP